MRVRPNMNSELLKFCEKPTKVMIRIVFIYKDDYLLRKVEVLEEAYKLASCKLQVANLKF